LELLVLDTQNTKDGIRITEFFQNPGKPIGVGFLTIPCEPAMESEITQQRVVELQLVFRAFQQLAQSLRIL
jgi:hypothetical protein